MTKKNLLYILRLTSPIFFGYVSIGIPFGLLVVQAGYPWWLSPLMSIMIFTGTGQYIGIGLFASGAGLSTILVVETLIAARHIFYGLSLITQFKTAGRWKPYLIYSLSDETYALLTSSKVPEDMKSGTFYGLISLFDQSYWVLGTLIGAVAGTLIKFPLTGLDFALTALFAVILTDQIRGSKDWVPPLIGIGSALTGILLEAFKLIPSGNMLIVSLCLGIAVLIACRGRSAE